MNESQLDRLIDKTHMRTTKRITQHIKKEHPGVNDKQIDRVNNHAIPTERKNKETINQILNEFISNHAINSIVCDDESAFTSKLVLDTLTSHNVISQCIITYHY